MSLHLIVHIAGHCVAFDTRHVDSVVDIGAVVPVPRADATVRGLAALRSRVVTVIDTAAALGLSPEPVVKRAVLADVDGHLHAFGVASLEDVIDLPARPLAAGMRLDGGWARAATGYLERAGEAILILDPAALVPDLSVRSAAA